MLSLRKLELLRITTVNHILHHDAWARHQRIRERERDEKRDSASNEASSREREREKTDRRVQE